MSKKRIGILTSGGDCPGLNAVIRGAVKASHQMGYDCVGFLKGYEGLYDPVQYVHLTPNSTRGILNQGGTILGSTNKGRFAATVGVDNRKELDPKLIEGVKGTIEQLGIDGLICVGGDGSLAVSQQFHEQGIKVVGVPKTIDNDLSATAFTFGFDSAIECATDALDRLHTTGSSHERIMVLEVMGRHAGWIALHSGIAGGGDVILIPEIGWDYENLCHKILHRESQGKKFTLVVVAEGAELPGGSLVGEERNGQQMKLGGVGRAVAEEIERRLHRETRLSVLGHLQRGGKPTTFDRVLATQFGAHAVRLVHEGRFGEMICSRPPEMTSVPIMEAVNELRRVDPHGPAVQAARALGISFGDRAADEIGNNVFDRLEPVSHVADLKETASELVATAEEAVATDRSELQSTESLIEGAVAAIVEQGPATELAVDANSAVEAVVETMLDLVSEADEAIHGTVLLEEAASEPTESESSQETVEEDTPEPELPETDATPVVAEPVLETTLKIAEEASPLVSDEPVAQAIETPALPDFKEAQAQLAARLVDASRTTPAKAEETTPPAPVEPAPLEAPALDLAERVRQKLAAAQALEAGSQGAPQRERDGENLVAEARVALEEALAD